MKQSHPQNLGPRIVKNFNRDQKTMNNDKDIDSHHGFGRIKHIKK